MTLNAEKQVARYANIIFMRELTHQADQLSPFPIYRVLWTSCITFR